MPLPDRWSIPYPDEPAPREGPRPRPLQPERPEGRQAGDRRLRVPGARATLDAAARGRARLPGRQRGEHRRPRRASSSSATAASSSRRRAPSSRPSCSAARPRSAQDSWALKATGAFDLNYLRLEEQNLVNSDRARARTATARGRRAPGGLRRGEAQGPLAGLRLRLAPGRHPALRLGLPRLRVQRPATSARGSSATPPTTAGSTTPPSSTCSRRRPTASSTPSKRREQQVVVANLYRQDFLAPRLHAVAELPLQPRRRRRALRRERLPGAAREDRQRAARTR